MGRYLQILFEWNQFLNFIKKNGYKYFSNGINFWISIKAFTASKWIFGWNKMCIVYALYAANTYSIYFVPKCYVISIINSISEISCSALESVASLERYMFLLKLVYVVLKHNFAESFYHNSFLGGKKYVAI